MIPADAIRARYRRWFETSSTIKGRDGQLIAGPKLNNTQRDIDDAIEWCELNGQPCWIIVLKPRKDGATTTLVGKSYHLMRNSKAHVLQIGDQFATTKIMWDMLRLYGDRDAFDQWPNRRISQTSEKATFSNGSTATTETAGDKRAGQGDTPTAIHAEEVAHWGADGRAANASDTMLALLNSIADTPGTYVFVSSTANGVGNWYHRTFCGAVSLAERQQGRQGNGWIKIFATWFGNPQNRREVGHEEARNIQASLSDQERRGVALHGWTTQQIAWRRDTIAKKCDGQERKFDQEYPSDPDSAFLTSGSPKFDQDGVTRLLELAARFTARTGVLERNDRQLTWLEQREGWVWQAEPPTPGFGYVAFADLATGEQAEGSLHTDAHACGIIRAGYTDGTGQHPPRLAACIDVLGGCKWHMDYLVERFYRLVCWYGDCIIIPEANNAGVEFIALMRMAGGSMWRREKTNAVHPGKTLEVYGFQTTGATRHQWVGSCSEAIREHQLDCEYGPATREFSTFVTAANGKAEAMSGCHDDWVTGIGLGLLLIRSGNATVYRTPQIVVPGVLVAGHRGPVAASGGQRHGACS